MEIKDYLSIISLLNLLIVPLIMYSARFFINQISKENVENLKREVEDKINKIEKQNESNGEKIDLKLQRIEEKINRFVSDTHILLQENRIKISEFESTKTVLNILDREIENNRVEIKKIESSLHQEFREGLSRVNSRLDEIVKSISQNSK